MRYNELLTSDASWGLDSGEPLFEMSNLAPDETGLPFTVFVSPRGSAQHGARVKVTVPPWGAHPEAVYSIEPFACVAGSDWLTSQQKELLHTWVSLNKQLIEDFWDGRIHYDRELRAKVIPIGDAPPANNREAVVGLRASAPKVRAIYWQNGVYHLYFDRFMPNRDKTLKRFADLGFPQTVELHLLRPDAPPSGILLWHVAGSSPR